MKRGAKKCSQNCSVFLNSHISLSAVAQTPNMLNEPYLTLLPPGFLWMLLLQAVPCTYVITNKLLGFEKSVLMKLLSSFTRLLWIVINTMSM